MSMSTDTSNAQAKAAPSWAVNVAVWVMKPGPMALVAMRNMAPSSAPRVVRECPLVGGAVDSLIAPAR